MASSLLVALVLLVSPEAPRADDALWNLLRAGGQVVLVRHATTPAGVKDLVGIRPDECAKAKSLTDAGREDARRIGAAFRARGIPVGRVLSSPWCRCLETAKLAFGRVEPWAPLDSRAGEAAQRALRETASGAPRDGNLVLVTHGSVVRPLTGVRPATAELVVLTPEGAGRFRVAGRLAPEAIR